MLSRFRTPPQLSFLARALPLVLALLVGGYAYAKKQVETLQTAAGVEIEVEDVVGGLEHPWGMAILPDGRVLVTERDTGALRVLGPEGKPSAPLDGTPKVFAEGQGGLMDVALDPEFEKNRRVYLSYAKPGPDGKAATALGRGKLEEDRIEGFEEIFVQSPMVRGPNHFGNRIAFSPDGQYLFLALGERFQFEPAQRLDNHLGKVIRIHPDGRVPEDNPFVGLEGAKGEIWSLGHRNIEAMAFQPGTDTLWVVEMGPLGGDELNRVEKGKNYGWPEVSWGDHYDGRDIPQPKKGSKLEDAEKVWSPVISPSGMAFYEGEMFPEWEGDALIGGLSARDVVRLELDGETIEEERLPLPARIRDVAEAPDGSVLLLTDEKDGHVWRMKRLEPPGRTASQ
jgi:glucose/arabinose dehydrogenase